MARAILTHRDFKTLPIPQGTVAWWTGALANLPYGWELANGQVSTNDGTYTKPSLLGRYIRAMSSAIGATGGADSHGHTIGSHNHGGTSGWDDSRSTEQENISGNPFIRDHQHTVNGGTAALNSTANSNHPAWMLGLPIVYCLKGGGTRGKMTVKDIKSDGLPPLKIIMAWHSTSIPAGWAKCDGGASNGITTPNLVGKYLRGVPNGGTNPGGTGGSATHAHSTTHSHYSGAAQNLQTGSTFSQPQGNGANSGHGHTINSATYGTDSPNQEPPYVESNYITFVGHGASQAAAAGAKIAEQDLVAAVLIPRGVIAGWYDTLASIPSKFRHCDGGGWANGAPTGYGASRPNMMGRFMRHSSDGSSPGLTGGVDTHTHTGDGHVHSLAQANANASGENPSGGLSGSHYHNGQAASWSAIDTQNNVPPYYQVAWIVRD